MTDNDADFRARLLAVFDAWVPALDLDAVIDRATAQPPVAIERRGRGSWPEVRRPRLALSVALAASMFVLATLVVIGVASTRGGPPMPQVHRPPTVAPVFYYEPDSRPARLVEIDWTGRVLRTIVVEGSTDPASGGIDQSPDGSQYFVGSTLFNSSGRRIGVDPSLPGGVWASENVRCADETPGMFAQSTLYVGSGTKPPRRVAGTGGSTDHGAPVLGACDGASGRAVVLGEDFPGIIPAIGVYQLQSGRLLVSRPAPCQVRSQGAIAVSGDTQLLVDGVDVCDVDTGKVVGKISRSPVGSGSPVGMSWDGSLVAETFENPVGPHGDAVFTGEVVSWRTGKVLWRSPAARPTLVGDYSPKFAILPEPGRGGGLVVSWSQNWPWVAQQASVWIVKASGTQLVTSHATPGVL